MLGSEALDAVTLVTGTVMWGPTTPAAAPHHGYVRVLCSLFLLCFLLSLGYLISRD